jgi:hypothetical protein
MSGTAVARKGEQVIEVCAAEEKLKLASSEQAVGTSSKLAKARSRSL